MKLRSSSSIAFLFERRVIVILTLDAELPRLQRLKTAKANDLSFALPLPDINRFVELPQSESYAAHSPRPSFSENFSSSPQSW